MTHNGLPDALMTGAFGLKRASKAAHKLHARIEWEREMFAASFFFAPIRLVSEANCREHWTAKNRRKLAQQSHMRIRLRCVKFSPQPLVITLTRFGPRLMDSDNLAGCFKHVQDEIAKHLGVDDGPRGPVTWEYRQEQTKPGWYGLRVEATNKQGIAA